MVKRLLLPLLLLIFGLGAIKIVRGLGRVVSVSVTAVDRERGVGVSRSTHSKDRPSLRILLVDVGVHLVLTSMTSVVLVYQQIFNDRSQSKDEVRIRTFYVLVGVFSGYISSCIGFYNNLLLSATFRYEAKKVLLCK